MVDLEAIDYTTLHVTFAQVISKVWTAGSADA